MAGRYVVLQFDSALRAEAFTSQTDALYADGADLIGVFYKPAESCQCDEKRRANLANWARGKTSGIWLCRKCRKPSPAHERGIIARLKVALGNDLRRG